MEQNRQINIVNTRTSCWTYYDRAVWQLRSLLEPVEAYNPLTLQGV